MTVELSAKPWELQGAIRRREYEQSIKRRNEDEAPEHKRRRMDDSVDEVKNESFDVADYILSTIDVSRFPVDVVTRIVLEVLKGVNDDQWDRCVQVRAAKYA